MIRVRGVIGGAVVRPEGIVKCVRDGVTEILEGVEFFPAEEYHQDFSARNPNHPYVRAVIAPKLEKRKSP